MLSFDDGAWYITGYCHLRKEKRTFRLDRIVSITCLEKENRYMNRQLPIPQHDKFQWDTYELMIDPALYRIIKEDIYLKDAQVNTQERGLHLTVKTQFKDQIMQLVLSHPDQVTALKPESLLEELDKLSKALYKKYSKL
jgi:predicted DNA-binding transcriptional regulator YafY